MNSDLNSELILFEHSGKPENGYIIFFPEDNVKIKALFQHLPKNLSDSRKAEFKEVTILKRTEPVLVYQYTGFRTIAFDLNFHALTPQEAYDLMAISSLLRRSVLPTKRGTPNPIKLFLGHWFINYAIKPQGNKYILVRDNFTEDENGFNAIIESVNLVPSENRFVSQEMLSISQIPQGWNEWLPSSIDVKIDVKIFLSDVWDINQIKNYNNFFSGE